MTQKTITLTKEQEAVMSYIVGDITASYSVYPRCIKDSFFRIVGGYAGTGKTTLLAFLRDEIRKIDSLLSVAFVAFTGKAASVLKNKLEKHYLNTTGDFIGTIHKLIYKPEVKWDTRLKTYVVKRWILKKPDELYAHLIFVDEGSMISKQLWDDLRSFDVPIIVMGDHGQLPPIGDNFNLMKNAHFKLTEIHRQALNSPIIKLSQFVREHGYIPNNRIFSQNVFKLSWSHPKCKDVWENKVRFDENLIVLCAFNATRVSLNNKIRDKFGYQDKTPLPGERIVCLKNNHDIGIMNGQIANMIWLMPEEVDLYKMTLQLDDNVEPIECIASMKCFGQVTYTTYDTKTSEAIKQMNYSKNNNVAIDYFDFGYVMSVHKSQGSEWDKVILFEQRTNKWDDSYYAKWLYTAITRAREKLLIISDYWG